MTDSIKAISLTQPWASLMAIGAKKTETRSWNTSYRGLIAIHASKAFPLKYRKKCLEDPIFRKYINDPTDLPLGCILAIGKLNEIYTTEEYKYILFRKKDHTISEEWHFGDYSKGRYAWEFSNIKKLESPIFCSGSLKLWNLENNINEQLKNII